MLGEVERVEIANVARSGHRIAHKPYMRDHETQIVFRALRQKIRVLLSESATVAVCAAAPGEGASWAATMLACATAEDAWNRATCRRGRRRRLHRSHRSRLLVRQVSDFLRR